MCKFKSTLLILIACVAGCQDHSVGTPTFYETGKPATLSEWNIMDVRGTQLVLAEQVTAYDLNTPLFSDYAHKLRTVWMPEGTSATYDDTNTFSFPVGTIISKTFYYPTENGAAAGDKSVLNMTDDTNKRLITGFDLSTVKLIETRLLVNRKEGWTALSYVWDDDEQDAVLKRTGDIQQLVLADPEGERQEFSYVVPNENQCAGCHATNATTRKIRPIGPKARHLNKEYAYGSGNKNQLKAWADMGILNSLPNIDTVSANAQWPSLSASLDHRARSYLDINCAHCHNAHGPADTSGLLLEIHDNTGQSLGVCKLPIAAGTGTGGRNFGIVPGKPEDSILTFRMASTDPAVMMPELGRALAHTEGVDLIDAWIAKMDGTCE